jgi:hypothetical protein
MNINDDTFSGLTKCKDTIFQQLGSMILAKEEKNDFKLKAYLETIAIFSKQLKERTTLYLKYPTNIHYRIIPHVYVPELETMIEMIKHFELYVNKLEKMKLDDSDYKMKILTDETPVKATTCELQTWMTHKFEQLGIICISKFKNETVIVTEYFNSIKLLIASIEKKILEVKEKDTKDDLKIILEKSNFLYIYAFKLLMVGDVKIYQSNSVSKNHKVSKKTKNSKKPKNSKTKTKKGWFS